MWMWNLTGFGHPSELALYSLCDFGQAVYSFWALVYLMQSVIIPPSSRAVLRIKSVRNVNASTMLPVM